MTPWLVAVRRPIGTAVLYTAIVVLGLVALGRLPVDLMPSADFPRISVTTRYPGVAPAEIETLITRPIEQAVATIAGVERIEASSSDGISRVQLRFGWGADLSDAVDDVRSQLDRLRATLPEEADQPVIYKFDLSAFPVATLGLSGSGDARRLRHLAQETLSRRLERVPGVAAVDVRGGRVREIHVLLSAPRLAALELPADAVITALRRENRNVSAGDLRDDGREVVVRTVGEFASVAQIGETVVTWRGERPITVADVAEVVDAYEEVASELWIDGAPGIQLRVSKQDGANTVQVVDALKLEMAAINRDYDGTARVGFVTDTSVFIRGAIRHVTQAAAWGAALAVLVLLAFLRDLRATAVVATSIPISVLATFALMDGFDLSLNVVSFGGLALGMGMLVDNAIVLVENIHRKRDGGLDADRAAVDGSREVASAITASTLTTTAVFVPVLFIGGFAGIFFREMAIVVSFALVCSLAVALTLVPALSARLLRGERRRGRLVEASERGFRWVERGYGAVLGVALRWPWLTVAAATALLTSALGLVGLVSFELVPEADEGRIDVNVELPVGTPVEITGGVVRGLEARVRATVPPDEIATFMTFAGPENWWRPAGGNQGSMEINLVPLAERRGIDGIAGDVRRAVADVPGARTSVRKGSSNFLMRQMRGGGSDRLSLVVHGHDVATARRLGAAAERLLTSVDGVTFAQMEREQPQLERLVRIDRERAAALGLRGTDVAETIETYVLGRVATRLRDDGGEYDVRVRLRESERSHLDQLGVLPVVAPDGRVVPLSAVARVDEGEGPTSIARENQERILRVNAGVADRPLGDVVADVQARLHELGAPDGFTVDISGEYKEQQETFGGLWIGLLLAIFLVYAVMAIQFESLRDPLVIMAAVPFAFIGMVLALVLTGTTFNMNSFLGGIVLVGIVVNNAIVLVETANQLRREDGLALAPAIASSASRRLRPILMTTLTTVLAMLPLALGTGEGSEIQAPLARVVIGGLSVSTAVTLLLVPCLYLLAWRRAERSAGAPLAEAATA